MTCQVVKLIICGAWLVGFFALVDLEVGAQRDGGLTLCRWCAL